MTPRLLTEDLSMDALLGELTYSLARLTQHPAASEFKGTFQALTDRALVVQAEQARLERGRVMAQAGVDHADDVLDDATDNVELTLRRAVNEDRTHPRYTRYFKDPVSAVVRMGLESQLEALKDWPASLATEPEDAVKACGTALSSAMAAGTTAVAARVAAFAASADHRVRAIVPLFEDVNAARQTTHGALAQRVAPNKLPRDWPDRFFRREARKVRKPPSA